MVNRLACSVLEEMRQCCKTGNYSYLPGLIEEAQTMFNRMESALYDKHDLDHARRDYKRYKKSVTELQEELRKLENKKEKLSSKIAKMQGE